MNPELLKMKEVALIYLDRSGGLQKLVDDCKHYNGTVDSVIFSMHIDKLSKHYFKFMCSERLLCSSTDSKQSYAVYRFIISVNPSDITELDAALGNQILHEPLKAAQIFQSVSNVQLHKSQTY